MATEGEEEKERVCLMITLGGQARCQFGCTLAPRSHVMFISFCR